MDEWIEKCVWDTDMSSPEKKPPTKAKRHAELHKDDVDQLEKDRNEQNTVKQTKWAVKCFEDWCKDKGVFILDNRFIKAIDHFSP